MQQSYNGCPASPDPSAIDVVRDWSVSVDGHGIIYPGGMGQNQDLRDIAQYFEEQFYARVEPPSDYRYNVAGMWGYEFRQNRNANNLSCHASGSAWDTNAVHHPNGSHNTFTKGQYKEIARICAELDYTVTVGCPGLRDSAGHLVGWTLASGPDEMHKEATRYEPEKWARVAKRIRPKLGTAKPAKPPKKRSATGSITVRLLSVRKVQKLLNRAGYRPKLKVDNILGDKTTAAIRWFQAHCGLRVDGIVGPKTYAALKAKTQAGGAPYPLKDGQVFGTPLHPGKRGDGTPWAHLTRSGYEQYGDGEDIRHCVRAIQEMVGADADGRFGPNTERLVKGWQQVHHLVPDGMVGRDTWKAMFA